MEQHETALRSTNLTRQEIALEIWLRVYSKIGAGDFDQVIDAYNHIFDRLDERVK